MDFLLLGKHPFLDFMNTRPVVHGTQMELLASGEDFMNLLGRLGLPDTPPLSKTVDEDTHRAAAEARAMREDFRDLLYKLFEPRHSPGEAWHELEVVSQWLKKLGPPSLKPKGQALSVGYGAAGYLAPLLNSAIDLLASPAYEHIKKCSNPVCVLWYVDTTKSQTRRWCSMASCGNIHKAREFRKRNLEG